MKTLSTEQQQELQELLSSLAITMDVTPENLHLIRYWGLELKPKRVRKKNIMGDQGTSCIKGDGGTVLIDGGTTFVENSVDNPAEV